MTSRDNDYLALRNLQCYDATNGAYVTPGYVLTAGVRGQGVWTNGGGSFGYMGGTGVTGVTGATGGTGPFGDSDKGDTGPIGPIGDMGAIGDAGYSDGGGSGSSGSLGATGTIGLLGPIAEGVDTIPANTATFFVSDASVTSNSMIVVFPLNWDPVLTNIEVYPTPGSGFTIRVSPALLLFDTPGTYTNIPVSSPFNFEMIGAGGNGSSGGSGGGGGYIQGTVTSVGTTLVKVVVGGVGGGPGGGPSGASYINVPTTGPLFAMAGAGGASDGLFVSAGWGGGGIFTANVAPGDDAGVPGTGGGGGSVVGAPGSGQGGLAGSECGFVSPGNAGGNAGSSGAYEQALGGSSPSTGMTPGGSGYAGGGSGCGGGGGSSFANSTYLSGLVSYDGNSVPGGTLPGYGRSNQGGYVSISSTWPAIQVRWWILRY